MHFISFLKLKALLEISNYLYNVCLYVELVMLGITVHLKQTSLLKPETTDLGSATANAVRTKVQFLDVTEAASPQTFSSSSQSSVEKPPAVCEY